MDYVNKIEILNMGIWRVWSSTLCTSNNANEFLDLWIVSPSIVKHQPGGWERFAEISFKTGLKDQNDFSTDTNYIQQGLHRLFS